MKGSTFGSRICTEALHTHAGSKPGDTKANEDMSVHTHHDCALKLHRWNQVKKEEKKKQDPAWIDLAHSRPLSHEWMKGLENVLREQMRLWRCCNLKWERGESAAASLEHQLVQSHWSCRCKLGLKEPAELNTLDYFGATSGLVGRFPGVFQGFSTETERGREVSLQPTNFTEACFCGIFLYSFNVFILVIFADPQTATHQEWRLHLLQLPGEYEWSFPTDDSSCDSNWLTDVIAHQQNEENP